MQKGILTLAALLIIISTISGCTLSSEEQQKKNEISNTAKQLSSEYLKEKYNIENAEISNITVHTSTDAVLPVNHYSDKATVCYKYKDKTIDVDVDTARNVISDDYQLDQIREDFVRYIRNFFNDNIIVSDESFLISGRNEGRFFMFGKDEYYDGNIENFEKCLTSISFQGFLKNNNSDEKGIINETNNTIDNFIKNIDRKDVIININVGIYKENISIPKDGKKYFSNNLVDNSPYESLSSSYDLRSNPVNLDKTLIKRTDDKFNIITEEFDYRKFIKISDDLEIPEYKYNGLLVDINKLLFENKDTDEYFVRPYFDKKDNEKYKIVYDFFSYGGQLGSFKYSSFIWFKYNGNHASENLNELTVLDDSIKPINIFKANNNIYFRVIKQKKYAIAVKKG